MNLEQVQALAQNINFSHNDFANLLIGSIEIEDLEAVKFLAKLDFNINFEQIWSGGTALSYAVSKENLLMWTVI